MTRFFRSMGIICSLLLTLGLLGCSSNQEPSKKTAQEVKPVETAARQDNNVEVATKADTEAEKKAATESKNVTPSQPKSSQTQQPASSAVTTTNANNTTKDSSKTAVTKPAAPGTASKPTTKSTSTTTTATNNTTKHQEPAATVTLSVEGPKDRGTIIVATSVGIKDGDTVYDVLLQAAKNRNIVLDTSGSGSTAYIHGIDNIYEFDYGAKSGWVFKLNSVSLTKSVGSTNVKDGDRIECYYTE
jgi:hypothetical protein